MKRAADLFSPPIIGAYLTTVEVAALEGVTIFHVSHWCRADLIFPAQFVSGRWRIDPGYILAPEARGKVFRDKGRPPGSRNKRRYPRGVRRPRKPKDQSTSPSQ